MTGKADGPIEILGATANNLREIDVSIPHRAITMIAGVSGCGKSSLLEDTLAVEGNNRMRRFVGVSQEHLADELSNVYIGPLPATIHFGQGSFRASSRTTVGTSSGLLRLLRDLFLKHAEMWSEEAGSAVPEPDASSFGDWLERHHSGEVRIWAVPMRNEKGDGVKPVSALAGLGLEQIVIRNETDSPALAEKGRSVSVKTFRPLAPGTKHSIEGEVARLRLPAGKKLESALMRAFSIAGDVVVELVDANPVLEILKTPFGFLLDSARHQTHPEVLAPFWRRSPSLLSFNQPGSEGSGACSLCEGLGIALTVALDRLVAFPELSTHGGALALHSEKGLKYINIQQETLEGLRGVAGFDPDLPWRKLPPEAKNRLLFGGIDVVDRDLKTRRPLGRARPYPGVIPAILARLQRGGPSAKRLMPFAEEGPCPACRGTRWNREAKALRIAGFSIADLLAKTLVELQDLLSAEFEKHLPAGAKGLLQQLRHLARSASALGLGHLSGDRGMLTISEGESRRLRLGAILHAQGHDLALLLDEPARGLHEKDVLGLVAALRELKKRHTIILNEHRFGVASVVDHVIELGPGGGKNGGSLVRQGKPALLLHGNPAINVRLPLEIPAKHPRLSVSDAYLHSLQGVSCDIPLGRLVSISGVSGSGKSSFVRGILLPALAKELGERVSVEGVNLLPGGRWSAIKGAQKIKAVVAVEQKKPETNRRSLVLTYLDLAEAVRKKFAATPEARSLGFAAQDFGINGGAGRCPSCLGLGEIQEGSTLGPCPSCGGRRFGELALAVRLEGLNIFEALELPIEDLARQPPAWASAFVELLQLLVDLDLGYLTLGRRVDSLSGGEAQRLRIAERLFRAKSGDLLLILDEPSAGLHPKDIEQLVRVLDRIVGQGQNTVLLVEHHLDILRSSDWIIDFGPEGGPAGGRITAQGTPKAVASSSTATGQALAGKWSAPAKLGPVTQGAKPETTTTSPDLARNAKKWLKVLVGQETSLPADGSDLRHLGIILDELLSEDARPHEFGGVDRDLAWLFIQAGAKSYDEQLRPFLTAWRKDPSAKIWIAPALRPMLVWGKNIPLAVLKETGASLRALRLTEQKAEKNLAEWRATGARFRIADLAPEYLVNDALMVGGGYAELLSAEGRLLSRVATRFFDLEAGIVAPLRLEPEHLMRSSPAGRCLACGGSGGVVCLDPKLLIDSRHNPLADKFYLPSTQEILKGIRRLSLGPFFKRLEKEGLWDSGAAFKSMPPSAQDVFLYGYWHRPGHGSFLKSNKEDPEQVSSWLRWDGFYSSVLAELERSPDPQWRKEVQTSQAIRVCPACEGTGLGPTSRLVTHLGRTLQDWISSGTVGQLAQALRSGSGGTPKEEAIRNRLLRVLEPLAQHKKNLPLSQPVRVPALQLEPLKVAAAHALRMSVVGP